MKNKTAFTLAEVIITLGIIGVVAAITIPALITNTKAHRLRVQFLKSYSTIQQAFKLMENDDVSLNPSDYADRTFYKTFSNYLKGSTDCGLTGSKCTGGHGHTAAGYKTLDGQAVNVYMFDDGALQLFDGTLLIFENPPSKVLISVDINGFSNPPNRWGYDLFTFEFLEGELRTMGARGTSYNDMNQYCTENKTNAFNGIACAQKAKEDTEYFKKIIKKIK